MNYESASRGSYGELTPQSDGYAARGRSRDRGRHGALTGNTVACLVGLLSGLAGAPGCATDTTPLYINPAFAASPGRRIAVLPYVDARADDGHKRPPDLGGVPISKLRKALARRGYEVECLEQFASDPPPSPDKIGAMVDEELVSLAPPNHERVFILIVDELDEKHDLLGRSAKASVRAFLVDTKLGAVVWKDQKSYSHAAGGIRGHIMSWWEYCLEMCFYYMLPSLPKAQR